MKNSTKSGLTIKNIIAIMPILILLSITTQLIIPKNNIEIAKKEEQNQEVVQEIEVAQINSQERTNTTTRGSEERNIEEQEVVEEPKYISINEIQISKDMDLTQRCGVSKEDFKILMTNLRVDSSGFFETNSDTIYDLCEKYELNEVFFCGLIAAESGWNISSNHRSKCNYISMMSSSGMIRYSSPEEGLEAAAKLLHNKYLTKGGSCYYGKTLSCVQKRFCPNSSTWVGLVYGCMKQVLK